ncbi:MAG: HAD family hydrolase [Treponema sp.]|nr:HAD family hydrolase [Treponema sp.]
MENIQAVIFDMDGVLLDSESVSDRTWHIVSDELNLKNIDLALNACRGQNTNDMKDTLRSFYGVQFNADFFIERVNSLFYKIEKNEGIPLKEGASEALEYLSKKYRISLASSTYGEAVKRQMTTANLIHYFESITTGDMVLHSKPNPEIYEMACKSLSLLPEHCVAIEDSPNGIRSAVRAGLSCIMIPDKIEPNEEIRKLAAHILPSLSMIKSVL